MNHAWNDAVLVDTHCHVDLFPDTAALLREIETHRILVIAVTNVPSVFFHTKKLAETCRYLLPAIGLHPELVKSHHHELDEFRRLVRQARFVGEVGLDHVTSDKTLRLRQRQTFMEILSCCNDHGGKVLTVHSRRAATDVISSIGPRFNGTIVLHWFTGTIQDAEQALENGFYFSVNPAMTIASSSEKLLGMLPRDRVLTETDGPFVKWGTKPAMPVQTANVAKHLSTLWGLGEAETRELLMTNFKRIVSSAD